MIVVDSSVWIDYLNKHQSDEAKVLDFLIGRERLLVGDIVLCEVLLGLRDEREARLVEKRLRWFDVVSMLDPDLAVQAAANYRRLRNVGVTIRKTVDLIIGTFCIEHGHELLHRDRDYEPMREHLGLKVVDA